MIQSQSKSQESDFRPDLTPLLDIIFIVMVFLLLTANISIQSMTVDLPTTEESSVLSSTDSPSLTINLLVSDPVWAINDTTFDTWEQFSQSLIAMIESSPKQPIMINSDKQVPVERMLQLFAFMQKNNINATSIIMEEKI
ncbi:biopolymer transporter ExbD [Vibrio sp. 10N.286.49.B3]|uniref:ExbD/TolR family protein n=1 Tax=Vibrio sp. 10N.286.49.B3 TaxID=1880855 RepID=UPI000C832BB1|nr:biopolymer transporter ExbD [Vibrio sp. 10N.286.49.B3]PMH37101.1 biopolymer transporter ExbD [Vibrio sp. 10N.286.49.B3]